MASRVVAPHDTGHEVPEWKALSSSSEDESDAVGNGSGGPGSPDSPLHSPLSSPRRSFLGSPSKSFDKRSGGGAHELEADTGTVRVHASRAEAQRRGQEAGQHALAPASSEDVTEQADHGEGVDGGGEAGHDLFLPARSPSPRTARSGGVGSGDDGAAVATAQGTDFASWSEDGGSAVRAGEHDVGIAEEDDDSPAAGAHAAPWEEQYAAYSDTEHAAGPDAAFFADRSQRHAQAGRPGGYSSNSSGSEHDAAAARWASHHVQPQPHGEIQPRKRMHRSRSGSRVQQEMSSPAPQMLVADAPLAQPLAWGAAQYVGTGASTQPAHASAEEKSRAVAAWVATNSPQPVRTRSAAGNAASRNPWARPLLDADSMTPTQRRGGGRAALMATSAPVTPVATAAIDMTRRALGGTSTAASVPHSPAAAVMPPYGGPGTVAVLNHLMTELAGAQRALIAQQHQGAAPDTPPGGVDEESSPMGGGEGATPGYRRRRQTSAFAWDDVDAGDGRRAGVSVQSSGLGSASKPPLAGVPRPRQSSSSGLVDGGDSASTSSAGLTRRSLLMQRMQAAGQHDADASSSPGPAGEDCNEMDSSVHTSPEDWVSASARLRAPPPGSGTSPSFSFRGDRPRAASPQMWQSDGRPLSRAQARAQSRASAITTGSASVDGGSAAPSELGSEMDAFRAAGGLLPTSRHQQRQRRQTTIPEEGVPHISGVTASDDEDEDDPMRLLRANRMVPDDSPPKARGGGSSSYMDAATSLSMASSEPSASPQRVAARRAALAERRVTALELALEEAVAAAEGAGWERDALVVRTAEAEADAASAREELAGAQAALAAEQAQNDYLRRLLTRAEEVRDAARADAAEVRQRAVAADAQMRKLMETLDVRDNEAVSVRARLRNDKARLTAMQAERDAALAQLRASHDRGQLLHRVLGLTLAACFVMALRLLLGTKPSGSGRT